MIKIEIRGGATGGLVHMTLERRLMLCRLIEHMEQDREYADRLGLVNTSTFKGKPINDTENLQGRGKE